MRFQIGTLANLNGVVLNRTFFAGVADCSGMHRSLVALAVRARLALPRDDISFLEAKCIVSRDACDVSALRMPFGVG